MRDMVIRECHRLAELLGEELDPNWNNVSNIELLTIYGDLRIDIETEEYDDEN
jgi:uncharacterized protein YihD (DUF1040 family)